jgi:hypothetical protein
MSGAPGANEGPLACESRAAFATGRHVSPKARAFGESGANGRAQFAVCRHLYLARVSHGEQRSLLYARERRAGGLIQTEAWAGWTAPSTAASSSPRTVSRSTASRSCSVKAVTIASAS